MPEATDPRGLLRWALVGLAVAAAAGLVLNAVLGLTWDLACFGGLEGPTVAARSPQGAVCHEHGGRMIWLMPAAWAVGLGGSALLLRRWRRVGGDIGPYFLSLVATLIVPVAVYSALSAPSDECTPTEQARTTYGCLRY